MVPLPGEGEGVYSKKCGFFGARRPQFYKGLRGKRGNKKRHFSLVLYCMVRYNTLVSLIREKELDNRTVNVNYTGKFQEILWVMVIPDHHSS